MAADDKFKKNLTKHKIKLNYSKIFNSWDQTFIDYYLMDPTVSVIN